MRIPVIAGGVALCAGIIFSAQIITVPKKASAQIEAVALLQTTTSTDEERASRFTNQDEVNVVKTAIDSVIESSVEEEISQEDPSSLKHTVREGESLEAIAKIYDVDWKRIYNKNLDIEDPNYLEIGQEILIPHIEEELEQREIPVVEITPVESQAYRGENSQPSRRTSSVSQRTKPANTAGNGYSYGYCTWHVKNLRPDLPNNLGNANTWFIRAASQGFSTGYSPRVGAVAEATTGYMHVAYVTAVHGDGTITVSEMNFKGWGVVNSRRAQANQFRYIY